MTADVAMITRVVGAGFHNSTIARAVILVFPTAGSGTPLDAWPEQAHTLLNGLTGVMATPHPGGDPTTWPILRDTRRPLADAAMVQRAARIWREVMEESGWPALRDAWCDLLRPAPPATATLPLPTAEAGLAFPLERARAAWEEIAPPDSPLFARLPPRPPGQALSALGRPWLGEPDALMRLSAVDPHHMTDTSRHALFGPPAVADWLRDGAPPSALYGEPIDPDAMAAAALGLDGADMLGIFDRMYALHHFAMAALAPVPEFSASTALAQLASPGTQQAPPEPTPEQRRRSIAQRRVAQLIASPVLLRMFGLARDVLLNVAATTGPPGGVAPPFWQICGLTGAGAMPQHRPTAVHLLRRRGDDPGCFYPPPRAALTGNGTPRAGEAEAQGLVRLGIPGGYALISLEPALALESRIKHEGRQSIEAKAAQAGGKPEPDRPAPTVRTSGLALVDLSVTGPVVAPTGVEALLPECAEELRGFDRLDVGIVLDDPMGTAAWHGVMNRELRWDAPGLPAGTVNADVRRLSGDAMASWEMNAAALTPVRITARNPIAGPEGKPVEAPICMVDRRLATWTGEPGGGPVNMPWWDGTPLQGTARPTAGQVFRWGVKPIDLKPGDAIPIGQHITLPTAQGATLPPLRFGWRYRMGLRRVFLGGVTVPLGDATRRYEDPAGDFAVPPRNKPGRRFLRHEPIDPPVVMLAPDVPPPEASHEASLQSPTSAVIVSWPSAPPRGHARVRTTSRVILVPPVSLEFATLHEAFDDASSEMPTRIDLPVPKQRPDPTAPPPPPRLAELDIRPPRDGLHRLDLVGLAPGTVNRGPPRLRILDDRIRKRAVLYYPDPAGCDLVLRLRHPTEPDTWFGQSLRVRVRAEPGSGQAGRWPNVLPVHVTLVERRDGQPALSAATGLSPSFQTLPAMPDPDAVFPPPPPPPPPQLFRTVTVALKPGQQATLVAWFAPSVEDIAAWFDLCEAMRQLADAEGAARGAGPVQACGAGMQALLGGCDIPGIGDDAEPQALLRLASLLHQRLTERPLPMLAAPCTIDMTHAVPHAAAPVIDPAFPLTVARRKDTDPEALRLFLAQAGPTPVWAATASEDGGGEAVFGGSFTLDTASASGVVLEATLAAPGDESLDPPAKEISPDLVALDPPAVPFAVDADGRVTFRRFGQVEVLRIDGLALPESLDAGPELLRLEELQARWAAAPEAALKLVREPPAKGNTARHMTLRMRAIPRHGATLSQRPVATDPAVQAAAKAPAPHALRPLIPLPIASPYSEPQACLLPATVAPAVLDVMELVPSFTWPPQQTPRLLWRKVRNCGLRLIARRPGFSSGEGERWGIIFWPPPGWNEGAALLESLYEEDIGALGRFVSAWGRDPIRSWNQTSGGRSILLSRDNIPTWDADGFRWHPSVLLPVPSPVRSAGAAGGEAAAMTEVSMLSAEPRFFQPDARGKDEDEDEDEGGAQGHYYLDLPLALRGVPDPFLRLGIVRYQENARPDRLARDAAPRSIRCSAPTVAWGQLAPQRTMTVEAHPLLGGRDGMQLTVTLFGPASPAGSVPNDLLPRTDVMPRTVVEMRVLESTLRQERVAFDLGGKASIARSASRVAAGPNAATQPVHANSRGSDVIWTAAFELPGPLPPGGRRLAVTVEEFDEMPDANADKARFVQAGTRFFGRLDLN